jgi:hypothetical protein
MWEVTMEPQVIHGLPVDPTTHTNEQEENGREDLHLTTQPTEPNIEEPTLRQAAV